MLIKVNQLTGGFMEETYYQAQMCGCWVNVVASGLEKCSWLTLCSCYRGAQPKEMKEKE